MEADFLRWLRERTPRYPGLSLGLTDDAALVDLAGVGQIVATVDMLTDEIDFRLAEVDPRRVGRKALAVNLSDLAAMAARPLAALVAVALPREGAAELARQLCEGMLPLAAEFAMPLAGGDTNVWDGPLVISVTALGVPSAGRALTRSGARPGDQILVTGHFGGSLAGHHFDFQPRIREACYLNEHYPLRAGIDVSDGLSLDLARLAEASGCGACLDLRLTPISQAARDASLQRPESGSPLDHALGDGEDFELILAAPPEAAKRMLADPDVGAPLTRIGEFVAEPGLWQTEADGRRAPLTPRGWEH